MSKRGWKPIFLLLFLLLVVLVAAILAAGCGGSGATTTTTGSAVTSTEAPKQEFTLAELAEFDGQDGRPAYIAVDGVVYDASSSAKWAEGTHSLCALGASAGRDLSDVIRQAPANMRSLLARMPVVGSLTQ